MSKPSDEQLHLAIDAIFTRYDTDKSNTLEYPEVKKIIEDAFKSMNG
jgi:hypothetical protein